MPLLVNPAKTSIPHLDPPLSNRPQHLTRSRIQRRSTASLVWFVLLLAGIPVSLSHPAASAPVPVPVTASTDKAQTLGQAVMIEVNRIRTEAGLMALQPDKTLQKLADDWASHLARMGRMEHRRNLPTLQKAHGYRYLNENLYQFSATPDASRVVSAWMRSQGHRRNLLTPRATLGVAAAATSPDGSTRVVFHAAAR